MPRTPPSGTVPSMSDPFGGNAAPEHGARGSEALQKLQRGECTLEQYLDDRIERAMQRLGRFIGDEHREVLREVLLAQALVDPVIQEYVGRAVGRDVTPGSD